MEGNGESEQASEEISDLNTTIESSAQNAIRVTVATSRYTVQRNELQGKVPHGQVASFIMITDGKTTTVSGFGHLIETFIRTKQLSGYCGSNENVALLSDDNYETSKLKLMRFDQTFENMPYDASKHPMFDPSVDVILKKKRGKRGHYKKSKELEVDCNKVTVNEQCPVTARYPRQGRPRSSQKKPRQTAPDNSQSPVSYQESSADVAKLGESKRAKQGRPPSAAVSNKKICPDSQIEGKSCTTDSGNTSAEERSKVTQKDDGNSKLPLKLDFLRKNSSKVHCEQGSLSEERQAQDIDDDYSIPSPDLGFFGSQEIVDEGTCLLDSILSQSPSKPEDERKLVNFLNELTSSNES